MKTIYHLGIPTWRKLGKIAEDHFKTAAEVTFSVPAVVWNVLAWDCHGLLYRFNPAQKALHFSLAKEDGNLRTLTVQVSRPEALLDGRIIVWSNFLNHELVEVRGWTLP